MHQSANEEQAALLLSAVDDNDDDENCHHNIRDTSLNITNDDIPVVANRPKTYQRYPISNAHPLLCFALILGAFTIGCLSGVIIMFYKTSQISGPEPSPSSSNLLQLATNVDLSIRTKLFQSIEKTNFLGLTHTVESYNDAANELFAQWKSYSPNLTRINKITYDVNLSKFISSNVWNGLQVLDSRNETELLKVDILSTENFISFSSLVKSAKIDGKSIYYVNYGRQEDFAYLFKNRINAENFEQSIVFMRRKATIISQTEQIHQAINYGFNGLVLFNDNEDSKTKTTNDRLSFFRSWATHVNSKNRQNLVDGIINDENHSIPVVILSYDDVQKIFRLIESDTNQWLSCPPEWIDKEKTLKIGGKLPSMKIRLVANFESIKIDLPVVMSSIRGTIDPDNFIMIGYQLGVMPQNRIINGIIEAYINQKKNGWNPKRSILFCAWSGLDYDHYTIRRWIADNHRFLDKYLLAYLDIGNGILGNSTLNLHGSPLFEQVALNAADFVPSPLEHNHTCHHRLPTTTMANEEDHRHSHDRKRRDGDDEHQHNTDTNKQTEVECEPHKLLDEWIKTSNGQIGLNKSLGIVQSIDTDSSAALFQLEYGIPSILIEMTTQKAITNDTFYVSRLPPVFEREEIKPNVYVAYTQFVSEIIRQLTDEPIVSFNLTNYANQIDKQVIEYVAHYKREYMSLISHIGDSNEFTKTINDLTRKIRTLQSYIDRIPKNDYIPIQLINRQLIEFERLFISKDPLYGMNSSNKKFRHILIGPAFGLTNTIVPFPSLSNILYGIPEDPPTELCDASKLVWSKLKEHIHFINRTLNGFDGLIERNQ